MKINLIEQSKCYKYALRSCTSCKNFSQCLNVDVQWNIRFQWLDCARCGCVKYRSDDPAIMAEKPLKTYSK